MIAVGTTFVGKKRRESEKSRGGKALQIPVENLQAIVRIYACQFMEKQTETVSQYAKRNAIHMTPLKATMLL